MKKVTCWYVKNADGSWSYNHLSDGWYVDVYPRTKNPVQRMNWKKRKWKQAYAYMDSKGLVSETAFRILSSVALEDHEDHYGPYENQLRGIEPRCPYDTK